MNTAPNITEPRFLDVEVTDDEIVAQLRDWTYYQRPVGLVMAPVGGYPRAATTFHDSRRWSGASLA